MMKSFFKKLAFVMALAMVVSAMAPAATAKAAENQLGICLQDEAYTAVRTSYEMTEGDEPVDFKFAGAPPTWRSLGLTWDSTDKTVAEVSQAGVVTAKAAGTTKITIASADGAWAGEMALTVKEKKVVAPITVTQKTANTVVVEFADAAAATTDILVEKLGQTTTGATTEIVWVVNTAKKEGNKVTVTTWMDFGNSDFRFTVDGYEPVVKALSVGEPDYAVINYANAYAFDEVGAIEPTVTVYDANGVELTGYTNWYYELVNQDANAYVETNGNLYLWAVGAKAQIKATLNYVVGSDPKTHVEYVEVTCVAKPAYTVNNYTEKYALVADGTAFADIAWNKTDVIIGNTDYKVVATVKDSLNKEKSLSDFFNHAEKLPQLDTTKYDVEYKSSNPSVALVHSTEGTVKGVNVGTAYVLVTLKQMTTNGWAPVGVIAAVPVNVQAAKAPSYTLLNKYAETLLTSGDFTTVTVEATTYNQYDGKETDTIKSVSAKVNNIVYSNETPADAAPADKYVVITGNTFTIDAKKFANVTANSITFTVKMNSGKEQAFTLNLKKLPTLVNAAYTLNVSGGDVNKEGAVDTTAKAKVEVVSTWAGSKLEKTPFYWGRPADAVIAQGQLYVTITKPNGDDITPTTTATGMSVELPVVENASGELDTMDLGNYIVKLYKVTLATEDSQGNKIVKADLCDTFKSFEIKNTLPKVTGFDVTDNKCTDLDNPISSLNATFKVGETTWGGTIVEYNSKKLENSVYVYSIKVKITNGDFYYYDTVTVGELFTLNN